MDFRAKDGIFHAFVRFFIGISSLTRYVCNSFSQVFIIKNSLKTESNFCLIGLYEKSNQCDNLFMHTNFI